MEQTRICCSRPLSWRRRYRVQDLEQALERLRAAGLRLIDEAPRPGAGGTRVAFVHPSATGGVLTELVEEGRA